MVSSTPNPIRLQTHSIAAVKAAKAASPPGQTAQLERFWVVFYAFAKATMASFKASHPKRHDLTLARTGGERPMEARGEKIKVSSGPSKEIAGLKKMMKMMTPGSARFACVGILA